MINFTSNHSCTANACGLGNFLNFETSICSLFSKLLLDYHEVANSSNFSVNSFNLRIDLVRSLRHNGYCFIHITSGSSITVLLYILLEHSSFKSITLICRFCLYQLSAYHRPAILCQLLLYQTCMLFWQHSIVLPFLPEHYNS
jgi:hypothetical protein